jgi:hypothetical protein
LAQQAHGESLVVRIVAVLLSAGALAAAVGCQSQGERQAGPTTGAQTTAAEERTSSSSTTTTATTTDEEAMSVPTVHELRWTGGIARWSRRLGAALIALGRSEGTEARGVDLALAALEKCHAALGEVGVPPNDRLVKVRQSAGEICAVLEKVLPLLPRALEDPDSDEAAQIEDEAYGIARLFTRIRADIEPFMPGGGRNLPVAGGAYDSDTSRVDTKLGEIASLVGEADIEVRCWSRPEWREVKGEAEIFSGRTFGPGTVAFVVDVGTVNLHPTVCGDLVKLRYGTCGTGFCHEDYRPKRLVPKLRVASSVVVFAHEVQHAIGISSESTAECFGIQDAAFVARTLEVGRAYAEALARDYYYFAYPALPRAYRSPECRPDGKLDLDPDHPDWP